MPLPIPSDHGRCPIQADVARSAGRRAGRCCTGGGRSVVDGSCPRVALVRCDPAEVGRSLGADGGSGQPPLAACPPSAHLDGYPGPLSLPIALTIWLICGGAAAVLLLAWSGLARCWFSATSRCPPVQPGAAHAALGRCGVAAGGSPLFWIGVGGSVLPLDRPLAGLARWLGSGGLALLQLLWGWGLWQISRRGWQGWPLWLTSVVLTHALGALLLTPPAAIGELRLAAWQPAVPTREKFTPERQQRLRSQLLGPFSWPMPLGVRRWWHRKEHSLPLASTCGRSASPADRRGIPLGARSAAQQPAVGVAWAAPPGGAAR